MLNAQCIINTPFPRFRSPIPDSPFHFPRSTFPAPQALDKSMI